MTLTECKEKLARLDPQRALVRAVEQTEKQYEDLQRSQLAEGKTRQGGDIHPAPYSKPYAKVRQKEGLQTAYIDLRRKGNYYDKMNVKVEGAAIKIDSDVPYEKYISNRYDGKEIYGLTDENMGKYRAVVRPIIQADIQNQYRG